MLFIQCHFLYLDSLLQFHHLVCKLQEQKKMIKPLSIKKKKKTNSDSANAHLFIMLTYILQEFLLARIVGYKGEVSCVDKAQICSRFYHILSQKIFPTALKKALMQD